MDDFDTIQTTMTGTVTTVTSYNIDGSKGASLWMTKPNNGKRDDVLGMQLIKVAAPYEMFEKFKNEKYEFPAVYEILADVEMGAGNKASFKAISVRKYIAPDATKASGIKSASSKAA